MKTPFPPSEHLKRKVAFEDVEAESQQRAAECGVSISPQWLERWTTFKTKFSEGDELWFWEHFPAPMTGGAGYCIVRNGVSIAWIATMRA